MDSSCSLSQKREEDKKFAHRDETFQLSAVGISLPIVEVRFQNLSVEADCHVGDRALPTLINSARNIIESLLATVGVNFFEKAKLRILKDVSGVIKPSRVFSRVYHYPHYLIHCLLHKLIQGYYNNIVGKEMAGGGSRAKPDEQRISSQMFPIALPVHPHGVNFFFPMKCTDYVEFERHDAGEVLVHDQLQIDSGQVELPSYADDDSDESFLSWDPELRTSQVSFGMTKGFKHGDGERKKGTPWTEEEHSLVDKMPASPAMRFSPGREQRTDNHNHKRGRSLDNGIVFKERDDDLALFNEVQNRERDNFLLQSNDDFEDTFVTNLHDFSDDKLGINIGARGESSDLLNTEEEKNDYEWLITPPDIPLFTSLDDDPT
ncbi:hypothetical protein L2E82_20871 [Cichorium intybus]|uniref:Uncharacterized protein n=1 Tax=Cichorium intybus TaxID=13427 RepID=A0ACB9DUU7_CICIN|nr:hypothetical protein L2E82_20871 [Cichorium intybus]